MTTFLFLLIVITGFGVFAALTVRRVFDAPFLFALHCGALMGIPPLLHLLSYTLDLPYLQNFDRDGANILLALGLAISLLGTTLGYMIFRRAKLGLFLFPDFNYGRSRTITFTGIIVLTLLGFLVVLTPLAAAGFNIMNTVAEIRQGGFFFGGLNFIRQFLFFGSMISGAFLISLLYDRKHGHSINRAMIRSTAALFIINILMSMLLGGKAFVIFPLAATLLAYEICVRKKGLRRVVLIISMLVLAVVGLQFFRSAAIIKTETSAAEKIYTGLYFIVYDTTLLYMDAHNKTYFTQTGEDFKNAFILLVPRIFWPDKPAAQLTAGNRFAQQIAPDKDNPGGKPPYGFAQWYVNFGWLGVFIGGMLTGWVLALLQDKYRDFATNPFSFVIMFHAVFLLLGPWPGGLHNTSPLNYALYIFPLFIFKFLTRKTLYQFKNA